MLRLQRLCGLSALFLQLFDEILEGVLARQRGLVSQKQTDRRDGELGHGPRVAVCPAGRRYRTLAFDPHHPIDAYQEDNQLFPCRVFPLSEVGGDLEGSTGGEGGRGSQRTQWKDAVGFRKSVDVTLDARRRGIQSVNFTSCENTDGRRANICHSSRAAVTLV